MTPPSEIDVDYRGVEAASQLDSIQMQNTAHLAEFQANMATTGVPAERITYIVGDVLSTIPQHGPSKIALLRLYTDWYESTKHELMHLWTRLQPGGVLIVDDFGHWAGARQAVEEYFAGRDDAPLLWRVDSSARVGLKP